MSLSDVLDAICRDNLERLRTLVSMQKCSDAQALRNTLLHEAVKENKKAVTEFLLQVGSNPNSKVYYCSYGSTALHIATENGYLEIMEILLNHGADINAKDSEGNSPLMYAFHCKKDDAAQLLLERGARLFSNNEGRSPLHVAATLGSLKITKMPLQKGAPVNAVITAGFEKGYTPLHCACFSSEVDIDIIEFLLSNGAGVDLKTEHGWTPLHMESQRGNVQAINLLLNHNSDIDGRTNNGYTPLYLAIEFANEGAALLLINRGAKLDDEYCHGDTILGLALSRGSSSTVEEILTRCPDPQGEIAKCKELFRDLREKMINILLKYCFYIEFLHIALEEGYIQIIESILKDKLELTANFDDIINSSLHIAVESGRIESVEVLIAYGAIEAINLYQAKDLRSSLSKLNPSDQKKMESHFENRKQEIEKLKFVKVPGYKLTCYALMTRSIHSVASYIKNEDLITHFQSDDFTTEFPIYAPIIQGRLRNAFQSRPFIGEAREFFNYYFQLPHVCVDHILSCLSLDDLKNVKDAM